MVGRIEIAVGQGSCRVDQFVSYSNCVASNFLHSISHNLARTACFCAKNRQNEHKTWLQLIARFANLEVEEDGEVGVEEQSSLSNEESDELESRSVSLWLEGPKAKVSSKRSLYLFHWFYSSVLSCPTSIWNDAWRRFLRCLKCDWWIWRCILQALNVVCPRLASQIESWKYKWWFDAHIKSEIVEPRSWRWRVIVAVGRGLAGIGVTFLFGAAIWKQLIESQMAELK